MDPVQAAGGVVCLMERIWRAFEAINRFMAAANKLDVLADAKNDLARLAAKRPPPDTMFRDVLLRRLTRTAEAIPRVF